MGGGGFWQAGILDGACARLVIGGFGMVLWDSMDGCVVWKEHTRRNRHMLLVCLHGFCLFTFLFFLFLFTLFSLIPWSRRRRILVYEWNFS